MLIYSRIASILLLISGVTHILQIKFFEYDKFMRPAVLAGIFYFGIGILIFLGLKSGIFLGAIIPALGAVGGLYRYARHQRKPLILFHVGIDLIIVPICIYLLLNWQ